MQLKSYFIVAFFLLALSACTTHTIIVESPQTTTVKNQGQKDIFYKDPNITFFPFLLRESNGKDSKIDLSLEFSPSEKRSGLYLPSKCIGTQSSEIKEECNAYTKIYENFLQRNSLSGTYDPSKNRVSFISEIKTIGSDINMKYAVGIHSIDSISEALIASWYTKDYAFSTGDFVKQSKNIGWFGENTEALTVPILSEDKHFIMTSDVTASSNSGNTYAQAIFEDVPLSFESGSVFSISLKGVEEQSIPLDSLVIHIPYMDNWKGGLLKLKSGSYSIMKMKIGVNETNEFDTLYCNVDICDIHFSTGVLQNIQELQFQY